MKPRRSGVLAGVALLLAAGLSSDAHAQEQPPAQPPEMQPPAQPVQPAVSPALPLPPPIRAGQPISTLVFSFENAAMNQELGAAAARAALLEMKAGLIFSRQYHIVTFWTRLPLYVKAVSDDYIRADVLTRLASSEPGESLAAARQLGRVMRFQAVMVGSVEEVTVDRMANSATATITVNLINTVTGEAIRTAGVSGQASGTAEDDERELAAMAARDAAAKALAEFGIAEVDPEDGVEAEDTGEGAPRVGYGTSIKNRLYNEWKRFTNAIPPRVSTIAWIGFAWWLLSDSD